MYEYSSIHKIFLDIHAFIIDYIQLSQSVNQNSNLISINLADEGFLLPATFNDFSQRAVELQNRLQRQIRIIAQKRRNNISKGIENNDQNTIVDYGNESYRFDKDFKTRLDQTQNKIVRYIRVIIDALELYDEIRSREYSYNITFRLIPILKHIQKQLCCISTNIQKILDDNASVIEQHLRRLQEKLNSYDKNMRDKLAKFISRDIRPPVLVIPCPTNAYSPDIYTKMNSSNALVHSDHNLTGIASVSSDDSLNISQDKD